MARKKEPERPQRKHVFCYARASTGHQQDSIECQKERSEEYFKWKLAPEGFTWRRVFDDPATSGKTELRSRAGGLALDLELQAGDAVIVTKIDRAFRNARDALNIVHRWQERGVHMHILDWNLDTRSPMGKFMLTLLAGVAEWERDRISERGVESKAYRRSIGKATQQAPYGFKLAGKRGDRFYVPCEFTRAVGKWVVKWRLMGKTYRQHYWSLIKQRCRNKKGREWSITTLERMFQGECALLHEEPGGAALMKHWHNEGLKRRGIDPTTNGHGPTIT